jgi:hypothetical protein
MAGHLSADRLERAIADRPYGFGANTSHFPTSVQDVPIIPVGATIGRP